MMKNDYFSVLIRLATVFALLVTWPVMAEQREYDLTISKKVVNYSGEQAVAMVINGTLPGPVLEFTEGDEAVITVHNQLDTETSMHWHGLLLPQDQDGVPYVTMMPIQPNSSFTYRFPIRHAGTYWYHSHTNIDEQRGQYGAIVIHPKQLRALQYQHEHVIQLSDWTDEDPLQVLANLKKEGHWYGQKKGSVISLAGYIQRGRLGTWLENRAMRMDGMDVSDVGYDAFLANGEQQHHALSDAKAGEVVRLRLINSAASSYFELSMSDQTPMTVIAADGLDVQPVSVRKLKMGMGETYDVLVTMPDSGALAMVANNVDGTGYVKVTLGDGEIGEIAEALRPDLYAPMDHGDHHQGHGGHQGMNHQDHRDHQAMNHGQPMDQQDHSRHDGHNNHHQDHHQDHSQHHDHFSHDDTKRERPEHAVHVEHIIHSDTVIARHYDYPPTIHPALTYSLLKSTKAVRYEGDIRHVTLDLTGDMASYTWSFNSKTMTMAEVIEISRGQRVQFEFNNTTMMHHPLHLHGHFFKVLGNNGDYDVLKHTVDVPPMASVTIEFYANAEKDWLFHCHNLYHAKSGMGRMVRYDDYEGNHHFMKAKKASDELMDDKWYQRHDFHFMSQYTGLESRVSNVNYAFNGELHVGDWQDNRGEFRLGKKFSLRSQLYVGGDYKDIEGKTRDAHALLGVSYILPFDIDGRLYINDHGDVDVEFETELQLSQRWHMEVEFGTEEHWQLELDYQQNPNFSWGFYASDIAPISAGAHWRF